MRKLRRAHQRRLKKRKKLRNRAIAAGTAAAITLGTGLTLHKALAAYTPDIHELPVPQDTDGDLLADSEEAALAYLDFEPDQNRNAVPDGVELAKLAAADINDLPLESQAGPGQTYKKIHGAFGMETCDQCSMRVNMGFVEIVNPTKALTVYCPLISLHYMEHGSFTYAGTVHNGRLDVPALLEALELRLPYEPNDHQLPVPLDADSDLLADKEELAIGYHPFNPDQNRNEIPDGIELAKRCADVVAELPPKDQADPNETYKFEHALDGLERCCICGQWIHMGGWEIINPTLGLKYPDPNDPLNATFLPDLALHYMSHGSFDCFGDIHKGRADIQRLLRVLELRFPYEPNDHQLPLDYVVKGVGQLAPDVNDLDGDLLADTEELAIGSDLHDPDQDDDLTPDGIEFAIQCHEVIDALPVHNPDGNDPAPNESYKIDYFQKGLELCEICGQSRNMGYWRVINPKLHLSIDVNDVACHYMEHGSFSYSGLHINEPNEPFHNGRLDIPLLVKILEMPRRCGDLGTLFLPGDSNKDCRQNFTDFADFADKWLQSTDPAQSSEPVMTFQIDPNCASGSIQTSTAALAEAEPMSIWVEGSYIYIKDMMINANCCQDKLELQMTVEGSTITLNQLEYLTSPCRCMCDFLASASFGPFDDGKYTLDIYHIEILNGQPQPPSFIQSTTVTIGADG